MKRQIMLLDRIPVRFRLSIGHGIWMAIIFTCIGFGLYKVVKKNLNDSVNAALISSANSIREARYSWGLGYSEEALIEQFFRDPMHIDQFMGERFIKPHARIINISGKVHSKTDNVVAALPVTPKAISRAEQGLSTLETFAFKDQAPLRQITLPVMLHRTFTGEIIQVGVFLDHTLNTLKGTALVLWIVLPLTLLISILLGYILTVRALKPVKALANAASIMGIDDLNKRLPVPQANDEIKELAQTFNNMFDRLEDAVNRLRRFTGDVSHELRTPLAVLRGEAELALRKQRSSQEYENSLKCIAKESIHMTKIIEDLLLLARAESNSVAMSWMKTDANNFMKNIYESVIPIYTKKNIQLHLKLEDVSDFLCSPGYLTLALKNLLLNAAKHSPANSSVHFSLNKISTAGSTEKLVFSIKDFGEGISKDNIQHIFDPFFRADTARNRASGGAGLGLSLALALIKIHDGDLKVESEEGFGSTFFAEIPIKEIY